MQNIFCSDIALIFSLRCSVCLNIFHDMIHLSLFIVLVLFSPSSKVGFPNDNKYPSLVLYSRPWLFEPILCHRAAHMIPILTEFQNRKGTELCHDSWISYEQLRDKILVHLSSVQSIVLHRAEQHVFTRNLPNLRVGVSGLGPFGDRF